MRDLPGKPDEGNFILADAHARVIWAMFAADVPMLPLPLGAKLQIFLQQHIGLRAYYPAIEEFYESVRSGHLERPLPLDAVEDLIRGVRDNTPTVFEPNVSDKLELTAAPVPEIWPGPSSQAATLETDPAPPPDPLGEVDPEKSHRFIVASNANALWDTIMKGEKISKNVEGWAKVIETLTPPITKLIEYLRHIVP